MELIPEEVYVVQTASKGIEVKTFDEWANSKRKAWKGKRLREPWRSEVSEEHWNMRTLLAIDRRTKYDFPALLLHHPIRILTRSICRLFIHTCDGLWIGRKGLRAERIVVCSEFAEEAYEIIEDDYKRMTVDIDADRRYEDVYRKIDLKNMDIVMEHTFWHPVKHPISILSWFVRLFQRIYNSTSNHWKWNHSARILIVKK